MNWWKVLAKMKFLLEARYSSTDPYYYIICNKMIEEIDNCALREVRLKYKAMMPKTAAEQQQTENAMQKKPKLPLQTQQHNQQREPTFHQEAIQPVSDNHYNPDEHPFTSNFPTHYATNHHHSPAKPKRIEAIALLTTIQNYPAIYNEKSSDNEKFEAWQKAAKELRVEGRNL